MNKSANDPSRHALKRFFNRLWKDNNAFQITIENAIVIGLVAVAAIICGYGISQASANQVTSTGGTITTQYSTGVSNIQGIKIQ